MNRFVFLAVICGVTASAQSLVPGERFDVASVKRNVSGSGSSSAGVAVPGRYAAINASVMTLLEQAYEVPEFRIMDAPNWVSSERFDVNAVAEGGLRGGRLQPMLRNLLAERFGLVAHKETRTLKTYSLLRARNDGKLGPQLRSSTLNCAALRAEGKEPPSPPLRTAEDLLKPRPCRRAGGAGALTFNGEPIDVLVMTLTSRLGAPVTDDSGLKGNYELELRWNPDPLAAGADPSLPSLFTALEEQLGLKLQSKQDPVEVVVIERISRPTEN